MKKLLVVLLAMALCLSMLAGCSKKAEEPAESTATEATTETKEEAPAATEEAAETEESTEPAADVEMKDFTILGADCFTTYFYASDVMEEFYAWQAFRALEAAKGVNMVVEWVLSDQYNTTLQTRFGAMNEIPYYVAGYDYSESNVLGLAQNGLILDLNEVLPLSDGTAAGFFTENDFGAAAKAKVTTPEGQMYWLPNIYISVFEGKYGVGTNICVTIRGDWLDQYGLEMPTTTEEFFNDLKTFNEQDPSGTGANVIGNNVYSYNPTGLNDAIAQWFGLVRGVLNVDWTKGEATSPWLQEGFTEYVTYANSLYAAGLYDPEMIGSTDTLRTKVANNQVGGYSAYALSATYEPIIEACIDENGQVTACYNDIYPIEAIEGVKPLLALEDPVYIWDEFFLTNQCTDLELAAAFLDAYYCQEHLDIINYGVEGKNFEMVNGERQWIQYTNAQGNLYDADVLNQNLQEKADERITYGKCLYIRGAFADYTFYRLDDAAHNFINVPGMEWGTQKCEFQTNTLDWGAWTSIDVGGTLATASSEQTTLYNELYTDIDTTSQEAMSSLIMNGNVADIDTYVATLESLGLQDLVDIYQERYDRFVG